MQRVSVVGVSGAGKSRLAGLIAGALDAPHVELDALFHQADWRPAEPEAFVAEVERHVAADRWVVDGNYRIVVADGPVWRRADTVVWLDLPRRVVMRQVTVRSLRRVVTRSELWNGNTESWRNLLAWDPNRSIIRWAWTQYPSYREKYRAAMASPEYAHLKFVRLTSHAEADRWLAGLVRPR